MQIAVATAHLAGGTAPVEQSCNCRQPFAPFLEQFVYVLRHETSLPPCREAVMLRLRYVGHLGRATAVQMPLGSRVEKRDMVGEFVHQLRTEATTLGQCIEQQSLIETPHHDDPIGGLARGGKGDGACRRADDAADLEIEGV